MRLNIYVKEQDIYDYIKSKSNYSAYIVDLVKYEMNNSKPLNEDQVVKLIQEYVDKIKNTPQHYQMSEVNGLF